MLVLPLSTQVQFTVCSATGAGCFPKICIRCSLRVLLLIFPKFTQQISQCEHAERACSQTVLDLHNLLLKKASSKDFHRTETSRS